MSKAAVLWDESYLWGVFTLRSLRESGLQHDIITASDIREGRLDQYGSVIVPGGWASNKIRALQDEGARAIRDFVSSGGNYFGICGGAGLATGDGLGLLDITRKATSQRVPSLSGPVRLKLDDHDIWQGTNEPVFNIWWPSQFVVNDRSIKVLASFHEATDEAMSSDISVGDIRQNPSAGGWSALEESYGLNLDPERMKDEPMVVEAKYGKGTVLLSLVHFDTPGDMAGAGVLRNIWKHMEAGSAGRPVRISDHESGCVSRLCRAASRPFEMGLRNFLWYRRGPLVQWRRGVRGLEYFTLYEITRELCSMRACSEADASNIAGRLEDFAGKAVELLMLERIALQRGESITFKNASDPVMETLRETLFSKKKSHGGLFKSVLDDLGGLFLKHIV